MKYIILIFLLIPYGHAQVVTNSIFSNMKGINPAVIGNRPQGHISLIASKDDIHKDYNLEGSGGDDGETKIEINNFNFFRGGKGGGFITTELFINSSQGERATTMISPGVDPTTTKNDINYTYAQLSFSLGKYLGLSLAKQNYKNESNLSFVFNGNNFSEIYTRKIDANIFKTGLSIPIGKLHFASFAEYAMLDKETDSQSPFYSSGSSSESNTVIGTGLGFLTKSIHLEGSIEKSLSGNKGIRVSGTAEAIIKKLTLGYTIRIYKDNFQDRENLVYNELAFNEEDPQTGNRTEHIINFAWGQSKGFTIGGSASLSEAESEEYFPLYNPNNTGRWPTTIKTTNLTLKLGYVW